MACGGLYRFSCFINAKICNIAVASQSFHYMVGYM